jgi:hypothetical protein
MLLVGIGDDVQYVSECHACHAVKHELLFGRDGGLDFFSYVHYAIYRRKQLKLPVVTNEARGF